MPAAGRPTAPAAANNATINASSPNRRSLSRSPKPKTDRQPTPSWCISTPCFECSGVSGLKGCLSGVGDRPNRRISRIERWSLPAISRPAASAVRHIAKTVTTLRCPHCDALLLAGFGHNWHRAVSRCCSMGCSSRGGCHCGQIRPADLRRRILTLGAHRPYSRASPARRTGFRPELNNATPSVRPHYRALYPTTGRSVPVPRLGTLVLMGPPIWTSPFASGRQVPTFHARAQFRVTPPSCRMPSGPKSGHPPNSSRVNDFPPVSTSPIRFRHVISGLLALVSLSHT